MANFINDKFQILDLNHYWKKQGKIMILDHNVAFHYLLGCDNQLFCCSNFIYTCTYIEKKNWKEQLIKKRATIKKKKKSANERKIFVQTIIWNFQPTPKTSFILWNFQPTPTSCANQNMRTKLSETRTIFRTTTTISVHTQKMANIHSKIWRCCID